jgi:hypothetical protein
MERIDTFDGALLFNDGTLLAKWCSSQVGV